jgi:hypothetical protein
VTFQQTLLTLFALLFFGAVAYAVHAHLTQIKAAITQVASLIHWHATNTAQQIAAIPAQVAVKVAAPVAAPDTTTPAQRDAKQIAANDAKLAAWGAAPPDYTKIVLAELAALWKGWMAFLATGGGVQYDGWTYAVTYTAPATYEPNAELCAKFLRGQPCTESERAFVWYRDSKTDASLFNHFRFNTDGTVVAP